MAQPIKKIIIENVENPQKQDTYRTLLVDGSALLFHSFADTTVGGTGLHVGGIYQFLLQMKIIMNKLNPEYVYVFFDNTYSGWLRWSIYDEYKQNRGKHYDEYGASGYALAFSKRMQSMRKVIFQRKRKVYAERARIKGNEVPDKWKHVQYISDNFARERAILGKYFEEMGVRTHMDELVEADDLIAYYCLNKEPQERIYIMTVDMDLTQLINDEICIYEMHKKKFITTTNFKENFGYYYGNTMVKKVFCGDSSDNIGNIKGLSESGFEELMPEYKTRKITIQDVKDKAQQLINERIAAKKKPLQVHENIVNGVSNKDYSGDFYEINEKIINLQKPLMTEEAKEVMDAMMHAPIDPEGRSYSNLYQYICEDGIDELRSDTKFVTFFNTFKKLTDKEIKRYNDWLENSHD